MFRFREGDHPLVGPADPAMGTRSGQPSPIADRRASPSSSAVPIATLLPASAGMAIAVDGHARFLPWDIAQALADDPALTVQTAALGDCSPWDADRLLCAIAAGDPDAKALMAAGIPGRPAVQALRRHPRPWARTLVLDVLAGDLEVASCRAGLPLPDGDPLQAVTAIAQLMDRHRGQIEVRSRLLADHPWIADAAWLSATGQLAETVVLQGAHREEIRRAIIPGEMPVARLLVRPERFTATRPDVGDAMRSLLEGTAAWNERGALSVATTGGWQFPIGATIIGLGVGGLHTVDQPGVVAGPLLDLDVASYYPSIIASDGIAPPQLPDFAVRVRQLMERRLAAKRQGDQRASGALKLVINSLYGQLGNSRSALFSPPDALRVVLTGQLLLLRLMDGLLAQGCALISANTDGILVRGDAEPAASRWEAATGMSLERTAYQRLWRTSVNDYLATGADGQPVKARGRFAGGDDDGDATRRAAAPVVARAAVEYLAHGTPIAETISGSAVMTDFTLWRRARDLLWDGTPVTSSVVRWVIGRGGRALVQSTDARTTSTIAARAVLVADPGRVPMAVIDRPWYAAEAQDLVDKVLGTVQGAKQLSLLE